MVPVDRRQWKQKKIDTHTGAGDEQRDEKNLGFGRHIFLGRRPFAAAWRRMAVALIRREAGAAPRVWLGYLHQLRAANGNANASDDSADRSAMAGPEALSNNNNNNNNKK